VAKKRAYDCSYPDGSGQKATKINNLLHDGPTNGNKRKSSTDIRLVLRRKGKKAEKKSCSTPP